MMAWVCRATDLEQLVRRRAGAHHEDVTADVPAVREHLQAGKPAGSPRPAAQAIVNHQQARYPAPPNACFGTTVIIPQRLFRETVIIIVVIISSTLTEEMKATEAPDGDHTGIASCL
jgi:hypothetical protein